jgi:hypothetical protein
METDMLSNEIADQIADSLAGALEVGSDDIIELLMNDDEALLDTIKDCLGKIGVEADREQINGEELHRLLNALDGEELLPYKIGDTEVCSFEAGTTYPVPELIGIVRHSIQVK